MNEKTYEFDLVTQRRKDDCFRCCVASILGLKYEDLNEPDIDLGVAEWLLAWREEINRHHYDLLFYNATSGKSWIPRGFSIGIGPHPMKPEENHAIICIEGKPVWDPNLSYKFIEKIESWGVLTPLKPYRMKYVE